MSSPTRDGSWRYDAPGYGSEGRSSSFLSLLRLLFERKWFILTTAVLSVVVAVAILLNLAPRYFAQSVVVIGMRTAQVVALQPVISGLEINPHALQAQIETEMQIIKSRRLSERLIERLDLTNDPEFNPALAPDPLGWLPEVARTAIRSARAAVRALTDSAPPGPKAPTVDEEDTTTAIAGVLNRRISVSPLGRSTALAISASSASPDKAALLANTLAELYVGASLNDKVAATERAIAALRDRLGDLQQNVVRSDEAVERYRADVGLVDIEKDESGAAQRLAGIRGQISLAQAQSATASARLSELRNQRGGAAALADVLSSQNIANLREQQANAERELREVLTRYGDRHPEAISRRGGVEAIRLRIREEIDKIASSLEAEARVAADRERTLRRDLAALEYELGQGNRAAIKLRELRREADANRRLYEVFLQRYQEVEQQVGLQQPDAKLISPADPPTKASWPPKLLLLGLAGIGSTVGASSFVVFRELVRGRLRNSDDVYDTLQRPATALVPKLTTLQRIRSKPEDILLGDTGTAFGESIQLIRLQIDRMPHGDAGHIVHFTSSVAREGKTSVAVACARQAAQAGEKVVVIDCDLRRSRIERIFGEMRFGLADLLAARCTLEEALGTDRVTGLSYIAAHPGSVRSPADLLGGPAMQDLLRHLAESYDLVVLDTPPVLAVTDALAVAPLADTTLLIVDAERTPRHTVRAALDRLTQAGTDVGGIVLSKIRARHVQEFGYSTYSKSSALVPRLN